MTCSKAKLDMKIIRQMIRFIHIRIQAFSPYLGENIPHCDYKISWK
jgi:hypothetical protein